MADQPARDYQDLAAILVHDLQGPLGNVVTSLEMLQLGLENGSLDKNGIAALVEIAVGSSRALQALVESLLDIGRLEAGLGLTDLERLQVTVVVEQAVEFFATEFAQRHVGLIRNLAPDLPAVLGNAGVLQRVLLNLVDNALRVSKSGEIITVSAQQPEIGADIKVSVTDEGPGVPVSDRERVFGKYERIEGRSSSKGLGLGLAFCRLAVEAHGGRIWVEASPNGGATFSFTLPPAR